jgi:5-methylcytosine-specific restriction endonuclease McrA
MENSVSLENLAIGGSAEKDEPKSESRSGSAKPSAKIAKRYIPTAVRRQVWINAQGKCQHCSSKFGLEYDHVIPFALGGDHSPENLRLLCRNCNQRKAIEHFGLAKMSRHLLGEENAKVKTATYLLPEGKMPLCSSTPSSN